MRKIMDLNGRRFGKLTVIERTSERKHGSVVWKCLCDCGNEVLVSQNSLKTQHTTSCGCGVKLRGLIDITGQKFGLLTVLGSTEKRSKSRQMIWKCQCECGKITYVATQNLKQGNTLSCGCYHRKKASTDSTKHGLSSHKLYFVYYNMLQRCYNKNMPYYHNYGKRGVSVCEEWGDKKRGFNNFYQWAVNNGYSDGLSIDRIDNNGNYEPTNCRWITMTEQKNNTRRNISISYGGEQHTIAGWAKKGNIPYNTLRGRLVKSNWNPEKAFGLSVEAKKEESGTEY